MRLTLVAALACLLALPAAAQTVPPDYDEDGCIALAARMDKAAATKQPISAEDKEQIELCVGWFNCEAAQNADDAAQRAAAATNEKLVRFVLKTCSGYDPPEGGE